MKDMLSYKEYFGSIHYNQEDRIFYGKIEFIRLLPPEKTERGRRSLAYIRLMHDDMRDAGFIPPEEATPR